MRPLVLCAALCLGLAGCSEAPGSTCGTDPQMADRASRWTDPAVVLDRYDGPAFSELGDLEVEGDLVWYCSGVRGLNVWDAGDPANLTFVDSIAPSDGNQQYPRCQHLALSEDDRVYVTNRGDAISPQSFVAVVDRSDPGGLQEVGAWLTDDSPEGLTVAGDLLLVAAHDAGLLVFDRGSGGVPVERSRASEGLSNAWQVRAVGDLAYVADGTGGLSVVDVVDPDAPVVAFTLALPGVAKDLVVAGDRAWVALADAGVAVVSLADPRVPALLEIAETPGSALAVAYGGDAVVVADWNDVRLFDVRDRDVLRPLGREPVQIGSGADSRVLGIAARDDVFFTGNWTELVSHRLDVTVDAPDLTVSPRVLTLAEPAAGEEVRGLLRVSNAGPEPVTIEGIEFDRATITLHEPLEDGGLVLAPGETAPLVVSWTSATGSELEGWAAIRSDDPDQPRRCVPVLAGGDRIGVGESAPADLSWTSIDGAVVRLDEHLAGPLLLAYFATW